MPSVFGVTFRSRTSAAAAIVIALITGVATAFVVLDAGRRKQRLADKEDAAEKETKEAAEKERQDKEIDALSEKLLTAVKDGNHREVERLLAAGASVNWSPAKRKYTRIGLRQEVGETPLHWATLRGDLIMLRLLMAHGAEVDHVDQDGKPPLHLAAFNGRVDVAEALLEAGADPNIQDVRGNTAIQWCILAGGSLRMLKKLLAHGAKADLANADGELPADICDDKALGASANLLRKASSQA